MRFYHQMSSINTERLCFSYEKKKRSSQLFIYTAAFLNGTNYANNKPDLFRNKCNLSKKIKILFLCFLGKCQLWFQSRCSQFNDDTYVFKWEMYSHGKVSNDTKMLRSEFGIFAKLRGWISPFVWCIATFCTRKLW